MEGKLGAVSGRADSAGDTAAEYQSIREWQYFTGQFLDLFGREIPTIGGRTKFFLTAYQSGFDINGPFLDKPAREWLISAGEDGVFERFIAQSPLGSRSADAIEMFAYYAFSSARLDEIGRLKHFAGSSVPWKFKNRVLNAFENLASDDFIEKHGKVNNINFNKVGVKYKVPPHSEESKLRLSDTKGGILSELKRLIDTGVIDPQSEELDRYNLAHLLKVSHQKAANAMQNFRRKKLLAPSKVSKLNDLSLALESDTSIGDGVNIDLGLINQAFIESHSALFFRVNDLISSAGLVCSPREVSYFGEVLKAEGLVVFETQRPGKNGRKGWHILSRQIPQAEAIIKNNADLEFYRPIAERKQVAGPLVDMPKWQDLLTQHIGVAEILRKNNLPRFVLRDSVVPVIAVPGIGYKIDKKDVPDFMNWVEGLVRDVEVTTESPKEELVFSA